MANADLVLLMILRQSRAWTPDALEHHFLKDSMLLARSTYTKPYTRMILSIGGTRDWESHSQI